MAVQIILQLKTPDLNTVYKWMEQGDTGLPEVKLECLKLLAEISQNNIKDKDGNIDISRFDKGLSEKIEHTKDYLINRKGNSCYRNPEEEPIDARIPLEKNNIKKIQLNISKSPNIMHNLEASSLSEIMVK